MLAEMRLLDAIETLWNLEDADILATTNDIFAYIVEANPSMVREFCLSEAKLGQVSLSLYILYTLPTGKSLSIYYIPYLQVSLSLYIIYLTYR